MKLKLTISSLFHAAILLININTSCYSNLQTLSTTCTKSLVKAYKSPTQKNIHKQIVKQDIIDYEDKIKGMFLLSAYGDAQGRVTEFITEPYILNFRRPDSADHQGYPAIPELQTIAQNNSKARFTDDTHMSLYLAHALLKCDSNNLTECLEFVVNNAIKDFIRWLHADQLGRGPGKTCIDNCTLHQSLQRLNLKNGWSRGLISLDELDKELFNTEGGSGAVMRTAPVSIYFRKNPMLAEQCAVAQGIITHSDSGSRAACAGLNAALLAILQGMNVDGILQEAISAAHKYDSRPYTHPYNPLKYDYKNSRGYHSPNGCGAMCQKAYEYYKSGLKDKPFSQVLDELRGWSGASALAAALYIFAQWNEDPYLAMSVAISKTPGDSDTVAKLVGDLIGLQYGYENIVKMLQEHNLVFEQELKTLENINDLPEYSKDFPEFTKRNIETFQDLAHVFANNY